MIAADESADRSQLGSIERIVAADEDTLIQISGVGRKKGREDQRTCSLKGLGSFLGRQSFARTTTLGAVHLCCGHLGFRSPPSPTLSRCCGKQTGVLTANNVK